MHYWCSLFQTTLERNPMPLIWCCQVWCHGIFCRTWYHRLPCFRIHNPIPTLPNPLPRQSNDANSAALIWCCKFDVAKSSAELNDIDSAASEPTMQYRRHQICCRGSQMIPISLLRQSNAAAAKSAIRCRLTCCQQFNSSLIRNMMPLNMQMLICCQRWFVIRCHQLCCR